MSGHCNQSVFYIENNQKIINNEIMEINTKLNDDIHDLFENLEMYIV